MSEYVKLGRYIGLNVKKPEVIVTEEELEEGYKKRQRTFAKSTAVTDRPVKVDDIVTIDFDGYLDGETFNGGSDKNYPLEIGSHTFIPGFEEQLVGAEIGQTVDVNVTFPEGYAAKDLAGRDVLFKVTVNAITEQEFIPLGESVKKEVRDSLEMFKRREVEDIYEGMLADAVVANSEVTVPDEMLDLELTDLMNRWKTALTRQGIEPNAYFQATGITEEQIRAQYHDQAVARAKSRLVLEAIAEKEHLQATKPAIEMYLGEMAIEYGLPVEEVRKALTKDHMDAIESDVRIRKVLQLLKAKADPQD